MHLLILSEKLKDSMVEHPRVMSAIFALLAALNFWAAHRVFASHPVVAMANGVAGTVLVAFAILLWSRGRRGGAS